MPSIAQASTATPKPSDQRDDQLAAEAPTLVDLLAAIPHAVDTAMRAALPERYTPETAAQIAAGMIARLAAPAPSLTAAQSTLTADIPLGGWMTAPVESALRDIDDSCSDAENAQLPFLAAKTVVIDYRSQAYGRRTEVWLDYGRTTGSLSPAKARIVLAAMRTFTDQFEAVIAFAEESAVRDFEGDPEIAAADREADDRRIRAITEGRA
ncbi:hypothetical protein [Streptomyces sp. NPDC002779]|uniref:hypothetical protein n=1 Tax=Streptomyces sp. NPDC002779 TaxID=3364664 RepID=UPI0036916328